MTRAKDDYTAQAKGDHAELPAEIIAAQNAEDLACQAWREANKTLRQAQEVADSAQRFHSECQQRTLKALRKAVAEKEGRHGND
jgi:hypothetical protein